MSKEIRVSEQAKRFIFNKALEDGRTPRALAAVIAQEVADVDGVPQRDIETIAQYIRQARNGFGEEDVTQWSPATSYRYPLERMEAVYRVWQLRSIKKQRFTVREATWVSRLSVVIKKTIPLSMWAYTYANRQLGSLILDGPFDVSDLDPIWSMEPWELATAYCVEEIPELQHTWYFISGEDPYKRKNKPQEAYFPHLSIGDGVIQTDPTILHQDAEEAERMLLLGTEYDAVELWAMAMNGYIQDTLEGYIEPTGSLTKALLRSINKSWNEAAENHGEIVDVDDFMGVKDIGFTREQERVYTMWLRYLAQGSKVNDLSWSDRLNIVLQLREWIKNHRLADSLEGDRTGPPLSHDKLGGPLSPLFLGDLSVVVEAFEKADMSLLPTGLLETVGLPNPYEISGGALGTGDP